MNQLPIFVNLRGRKVILLGDGPMADAKRHLYERAGAEIVGDERAMDVALAVVALEDDEQAVAAVERLKARGLLVNAVDRSALCDFTTPAIIDRDPLLIAIGTGGASAGLAKALRQRLERLIPANIGGLASALSAARDRLRQIWPDNRLRRRAIDAALDGGGPLDIMADQPESAVADWLDAHVADGAANGIAADDAETVVIDLVLTSNDPDDLTLRQARLLGKADQLFISPGIAPAIVERARADAEKFTIDQWHGQHLAGLTIKIAMKE